MKHKIIFILLFAVPVAVYSTYGVEAIDTISTWSGSGLEGWSHTAPEYSATISSTNGQLELVHKSQSIPVFVEDRIRRPIMPGALLERIEFTLQAKDIRPSRVRLSLHSAGSGVTWRRQLNVPQVGESLTYSVPVKIAEGWSRGAYSTEDRFLQDLRSVDMIAVEVLRHSSTLSQKYALDDFRIQGVQFSGDHDMDYMPDAWETAHGFNTNDFNDADLDADRDGMSNYAEFRAGTDPRLAGSQFKLRLSDKDSGIGIPFELSWNSLSNRWYTIRRSTNLVEGFAVLQTGIESQPPANTYQDLTATNAPAYFYKIEVEPEL